MVPDISTGGRTYGLLAYLYGPGRRDEHIDPHLVTAWVPELAPDPGRDGAATLKQLADALDLPVLAVPEARRPARHVWHCPVRTAPGDRYLTDTEWSEAARRIVHATGIAEYGDDKACRWVAVRHADDHIHIVATLKREDGRSPRRHQDGIRAQAECRKIEKEWGLQILNEGDGTAAQRPTSAERAKAERTGRPEPARETLREHVRQALAGAADEAEFFHRLTDAGLRLEVRRAPSGDALGYKVALPGDRNRTGQPIWFPGSRLAPDLSLPQICRRLEDSASEGNLSSVGDFADRPALARRGAMSAVEQAVTQIAGQDDASGAAHLVGVGTVLDAVAQTASTSSREELTKAARAFERATRSHVRAEHADHRALRAAARGITHAGNALGKGEDGGATAMLLSTLVLATIAATRWHSARGHAQQAAAARQAAEHLRAAYRTAATTPMAAMHAHERRLSTPQRDRYARAIEDVVPERADSDHHGPGWDALVATLGEAEEAGYHAEALLRQAVEWRELVTADSVPDVLVWRLRRIAHLPATPGLTPTATTHMTPLGPPQFTEAPTQATTTPHPKTDHARRPGYRR
ncbi:MULTISPECIES: relaxase/mobilization nuclease domain-containing protein [unclassified Streptomyces]|uniref:relaxase/mobilization nuclease domain-containing protein n=1 Tax=unclassified Streptomyces TaxID=2593676 RepID=UPI002E17D88D|nr:MULTISPECIES: relaxase/mobilization nuclease domain-containing protein [unclassified Streptomyces]